MKFRSAKNPTIRLSKFFLSNEALYLSTAIYKSRHTAGLALFTTMAYRFVPEIALCTCATVIPRYGAAKFAV